MIQRDELPIGFTMELSLHPDILNTFSHMSQKEMDSIVEGARRISSKEEMRSYVKKIGHAKMDHFIG